MTGNTFATARPPREARRGDIPDEMIGRCPRVGRPLYRLPKGSVLVACGERDDRGSKTRS